MKQSKEAYTRELINGGERYKFIIIMRRFIAVARERAAPEDAARANIGVYVLCIGGQ